MELIVRHDYDVLTNTLLQINNNFIATRGFCCHLDTIMGVHLVDVKSVSNNGCINSVWLVDLEVGEDEFDSFEIRSILSMVDASSCVGEISFEVKNPIIYDDYLCTTKVYDYFLERCGLSEKS